MRRSPGAAQAQGEAAEEGLEDEDVPSPAAAQPDARESPDSSAGGSRPKGAGRRRVALEEDEDEQEQEEPRGKQAKGE